MRLSAKRQQEFFERAAGATGFTQQELHIILDALPVPLSWGSLSDGRFQFVNRAFTATFGYHADDFPTVDAWIDSAYPRKQDRDDARRRWKDIRPNADIGVSEIAPFEIEVRCHDGSIKAIHHRAIVLHSIGIGIAV